jgi:hypothetical protein
MNRYSAALAALFVVCLILPISAASAQIAPGDVEMPTGDVWPSREERVYIPRNALVPKSVDEQANAPRSRTRLRRKRRTRRHKVRRPHRPATAMDRNRHSTLNNLTLIIQNPSLIRLRRVLINPFL